MDEKQIREITARARQEKRDALTELEGLSLLDAMGVPHAKNHFVKASGEVKAQKLFDGPRAVVKVISPEILHKTEMGGVAIVENSHSAIEAAIKDMEGRFTQYDVHGYTINEFLPFEQKLGHEIIIGYRFAKDFGPVISFGPGGIYTEFLAKQFRPGVANIFFSPLTATRKLVEDCLKENAVRNLLCGGIRGTKNAVEEKVLVDAIMAFIDAAPVLARAGVSEFEVNPMVVAKDQGRLVALDALVKLEEVAGDELEIQDGKILNRFQAIRPTGKIAKILKPASAAIIGVSEKGMNNGRIILRNLIENGFDQKRLYVVKPGADEIDGIKCVPDVKGLPEKVDLFVLVIPAAQAPECIAELAELDKAESIIVIPGGLEEKSGTEALVARMQKALDESRKTASGGPLINGGNCLGIRSVSGKYNTLFIPEYKLPMPPGQVDPVAFISQSGAFAITRISKNPTVNPEYCITCGNQMDVTIGDYLDHLKNELSIKIFAVYVEGFKPLDGEKTLKACKEIVASGRSVIFYRAGRTAEGAAASASHTASIAGDYPVTKALMEQAGAVVAESLDEFDDLLIVFKALADKKLHGRRLGAISGAGFECVAFADNLGQLEIGEFSKSSHPKLEEVFEKARITEIVDIHNPLDLTPMGGDETFHDSLRIMLDDPGMDAAIVGMVPLTVKMNSLAKGEGHDEDYTRADSLANRLKDLARGGTKSWVAVVDSGELYDPFAKTLLENGVATFRTADRALAMLNAWIKAKEKQASA